MSKPRSVGTSDYKIFCNLFRTSIQDSPVLIVPILQLLSYLLDPLRLLVPSCVFSLVSFVLLQTSQDSFHRLILADTSR